MNPWVLKRRGAEFQMCAYPDGSPALLVNGEVISVNLAAYKMVAPEGHVYIPGYSEHSGLPAKLIDLGVATPIYEVTFGPFDACAWLMRIL